MVDQKLDQKEFRGTKMIVDGKRLSSLFQINKISRPSTPVEHDKQETQFGYRYIRTKEKDNTLKIDITIRSNEINDFRPVADLRDEIVRELYKDGLRKFEFTDQPDRYWEGKLDGSLELEYINKRNAKTTIELWIPAGHAISSLNEKEFTNDVENDPGVINAVNGGTRRIYPMTEVSFTKECGYIAFMNESGNLLQFGNPDEVDGTVKEKNEQLFDDHMLQERPGWVRNQGITPPVTYRRDQVGTVSYINDSEKYPDTPNEGYFKTYNYGDTSLPSWHGLAMTKIIPLPSDGEYPENWHSSFRFDFNNDGEPNKNKPRKIGHFSVTFSDENDKIICSFGIEDNNPSAEKGDMFFYIGDKRVFEDRKTTNYYINQRYPGKWIAVEKIGNVITLRAHSFGKTKTFTIPSDAGMGKLRKVTVYIAQYKNNPVMRNIVFRALEVTKYNTKYWSDFKNIFQPGDFLSIDFGTRSIMRNGQPLDKLGAYGNEWFPLVPGNNEVVFSYSDWVIEPPQVKMKFKELWY